jgi:hypothetical protein
LKSAQGTCRLEVCGEAVDGQDTVAKTRQLLQISTSSIKVVAGTLDVFPAASMPSGIT